MENELALAPLERAFKDLVAAVRSLPETCFLSPMHGWSARDIVAHSIGRNRHLIEASGSSLRGESPAYYADVPHEYRNLIAAHVAAHPSRSKDELLCEFDASLTESATFVRSLPPEELANSHGVLHYSGRPATVGGLITSLTQDYQERGTQIRALLGTQ